MTIIAPSPRLTVYTRPSTKQPGRVVSRLPSHDYTGRPYPDHIKGLLLLFDDRYVTPPADLFVDIAIVGTLWHRHPIHPTNGDNTRPPKALFVRPLTDQDKLVYHKGFIRHKDRYVTASIDQMFKPADMTALSLTPGRMSHMVRRYKPGIRGSKLLPGYAYVSREQVEEGTLDLRVTGLPCVTEMEWAHKHYPVVQT